MAEKVQQFSYHTHTVDSDGSNTVEEMVLAAKEKGWKSLGITNHMMVHPNMFCYNKMHYFDFDRAKKAYQKTCRDIRKIADKHDMTVYSGFEVDFFCHPEWRKNFEKMKKELDVDYLIGAKHFIQNKDESRVICLYDFNRPKELPKEMMDSYYGGLKEAIKSGYFDMIAHIDLLKYFKLDDPRYWEDKLEIAELLAKHGVATELNTSGLGRTGEFYPNDAFLKALDKANVKLIVSDDAHKISELGREFEKAEETLARIKYKNRVKNFKELLK